MTVYNSGSAFPGTLNLENDAPQEIIVANAFAFPSGATEAQRTITGARLYMPPAVVASAPATWYAMLFASENLAVAPVRAQTGAKGTGGWVEVTFSQPYIVPAGSTIYMGYTLGGVDYGTPGSQYLSYDGGTVALSGTGGVNIPASPNRSRYRYGAGAAEAGGTTLWGIDVKTLGDEGGSTPPVTPVTVNAGADRTITAGEATSLTATPANGSGTKTYAWTVVSGPATSGTQFSAISAATTNFTPSGGAGTYVVRVTVTDTSGTATDDVTVTVINAVTNTSTVSAVNASTGWTPNSGTVLSALNDGSNSTYVTSLENPSNHVLDVNMGTITAPSSGMGCRVTLKQIRYSGTASSASVVVRIYNGTTLRASSSALPITSTPTDLAVDFSASALTSVDWATVRVTVSVTATA